MMLVHILLIQVAFGNIMLKANLHKATKKYRKMDQLNRLLQIDHHVPRNNLNKIPIKNETLKSQHFSRKFKLFLVRKIKLRVKRSQKDSLQLRTTLSPQKNKFFRATLSTPMLCLTSKPKKLKYCPSSFKCCKERGVTSSPRTTDLRHLKIAFRHLKNVIELKKNRLKKI